LRGGRLNDVLLLCGGRLEVLCLLWWKLEVLCLWCRGVAVVEGPAELCERTAMVEERPELRRGVQIGDCESRGK